jgi:hypothetical protein
MLLAFAYAPPGMPTTAVALASLPVAVAVAVAVALTAILQPNSSVLTARPAYQK